MKVQLFHAFLTIARELSFTAAADRLNVSQPRISLMVRKLEESLGFLLFHRTSRQVRLTAAGMRFLPVAQAAFDAINEARELARELAREGQLCLRLGAPFYTASVPARMAVQKAFLSSRVGARMEVTGGLTPGLLRNLRAGEVDVVITTSPIEDEGEFESIALAGATALIGIPPGHPLAGRLRVEMADLAGMQAICLPRRIGVERFNAWHRPAIAAGVNLVEAPDMALSSMVDSAIERNLLNYRIMFDGMTGLDSRLAWHQVCGPDNFVDLVALRSREHKPSFAAQMFWDVACAHSAAAGYAAAAGRQMAHS